MHSMQAFLYSTILQMKIDHIWNYRRKHISSKECLNCWGFVGPKMNFGGQIRCIGPREPLVSKIRRSRTLKIWGNQKFVFCWYSNLCCFSFHLRPQSSQLDPNWPSQTSKPPQNFQKLCGGPWGNPHYLSNIRQTCGPILILSIGLQIWILEVVLHESLKLLLKRLTPQTRSKSSLTF